MATGLDFPRTTVRIFNHFEGPNFVNGLAIQNNSYTIIDSEHAMLEFAGGFNDGITYVQIVEGEGFGLDANGRYTGIVTGYLGYEKGTPENHWTFQGLDTSLDRLNTLVADPAVTFQDLLLIPLTYTFLGAEFDDVFINGSFDDIARGYGGDDNFDGLAGADSLYGNAGDDLLTGGDGDDLLAGGGGDDVLLGGRGNDAIRGLDGNDRIDGGEGDDAIAAGSGDDSVEGGAGGDAIDGGSGGDSLDGGDGDDSVSGQAGNDTLVGGSGGDTLDGGLGHDLIRGEAGANLLYGRLGDDVLAGDSDSDQLFGGRGADRLGAGTGADFIIGGAGDDTLSGNVPVSGAGDLAADTFLFEAAFGHDVITDFEIGFDGIELAAGITAADVSTETLGEDVLVTVAFLGTQTILVENVAALFNPQIDILIA
jgi:Ca2+-binding RTX toxin-like protein